MLLFDILAYNLHGKIWKSWFKTITLKNELRREWRVYSIDFQYYYKYIIKKREIFTDNFPIRRYINKTKSRIPFRITKKMLSPTFNTWNYEITYEH